nr:DUF5110 domain-containing protein [Lachnospiraceae bacterium]
KSMGIDPESGETVEFDASNPTFVENYFKYVCNPMEEEGVDFWWIDWQQGTKTKVEGLDPLWILNHFHYLDSGRDGKRPMTFSRYAGPGSHRYPIGFSGDTVISWDSLQFQPYFTSTASNIGYGWWSHDIGGHTYGGKNDEMEARWYQYGVFSPIMRLHSTKNEFNGKEPWRFKKEARDTMIDFLQLRHKLIPYLYTMNYRAYAEDAPIVEPLSYVHGPKDIFEEVPNEYYFGTEMIVSPITTKRIEGLNLACQKTWLPKGVFYDFFSGMRYEVQEEEGRLIENFRDINSIPVFVKAGSILPMVEKLDAASVIRNPEELVLRVYLGADGSFTLYEDDNDTTGYLTGVWAKTKITLDEKAKTLKIHPVDGDVSILPAKRKIKVEFVGYDTGENTVELEVEPKEGAVITWNQEEKIVNPYKEAIFDLLNQAEITFKDKQEIYDLVEAAKDYTELKRVLDEKNLDFEEPEILKAAVLEICSLM